MCRLFVPSVKVKERGKIEQDFQHQHGKNCWQENCALTSTKQGAQGQTADSFTNVYNAKVQIMVHTHVQKQQRSNSPLCVSGEYSSPIKVYIFRAAFLLAFVWDV